MNTRSEITHITDTTLPNLVQEFASLKVWFATHEVTGKHPDGGRKHRRLCDVVDELRRRGAL